MSRRVTVGWLVAALGVAQLPRQAAAATPAATQGYGADPRIDQYIAPWPRLLGRTQLAQLAVLADLILPAGGEAPAPSALGIPDFLDEWISAPYPTQMLDRTTVINGLAWMDKEAARRGGGSWGAAPADLQSAMIAGIAVHGGAAEADPNTRFFRRVRNLVVGAYYTTDKGMAALGYIGNVALESYPPVSGVLSEELEKRMRMLSLL